MDSPKNALGSQTMIQPYETSLGYGSTDVGDVSIAVPTVGVRVAGYVPGTSGHSWQAVASTGTSIGFKGAHAASKTLALAAIEILENEELREAAKTEHTEKLGENFHYEPLLGERPPPLDYRE